MRSPPDNTPPLTPPSPGAQATRLAPSPTGALHLGNARTFLVTWALARQAGWRIVLRIEDLDTPRVKPGVVDLTVDLLAWLGMDWDEGPLIQSHDLPRHRHAMEQLASRGCVYPCSLTRAQVEAAASAPQDGAHDVPFPAHLRPMAMPSAFDDSAPAWRLVVPPGPVPVDDAFVGRREFDVSTLVGDFVVWTRRDPALPGQPAYQLAVVLDDFAQGVTQVVRGDDLLDSAARQILVARALGLPHRPVFTHIPLVRGPDSRRLAKRHGDTRLDTYRAQGVRPERVIGLVASWCDPEWPRGEMSAREFREWFNLRRMPTGHAVFTQEDDRWLRSATP